MDSYNSELQVTITVSWNYTLSRLLYCSIHTFSVFSRRCWVRVSNNGDSSAVVLTSFPDAYRLITNSWPQLMASVAITVYILTVLAVTRCRLLVMATSQVQSQSDLLYYWRLTANQFDLASSPLRIATTFFFSWTLAVIALMWHFLWREDGLVSYEYAWPFWSLCIVHRACFWTLFLVLSLYSLSTDRPENTASNSSAIVASRYLVMACLLIESLARNGQCFSSQ
jgi:hypothetical protein